MRRAPNLPSPAAVLLGILVVALALVFVPRLLGWPVEAVLSGSMEPGTPVGSAVVVQPVSAGQIQPGDVITFKDGGYLVTHRVLEVHGDDGTRRFLTKGDANEDPDPDPVPASALQGRVRFTVPYLGYAGRELSRPAGRFLIAVTVLLLMISGLRRPSAAPLSDGPSARLRQGNKP